MEKKNKNRDDIEKKLKNNNKEELVKKKKNQKRIITILIILLLILMVLGATIAYFSAKSSSPTKTINTGKLVINYVDGDLINVSEGIEPIEESEILTSAAKKTFSVAKSSDSENIYARIDLIDIEISDNFKDYDLKWALYQGDEKVTTGSFIQTLDGSTSINMATNVLLNSTTPLEYNLYIWIQETGTNQSALMAGTLTAKIKITGEDTKQNTLASKILGDNNKNVITTTPTFSASSTDLGLYVQQDDETKSNYGFPTYYYRGDVTNNYVQLGTYKSEITNSVYSATDGTTSDVVVASTNMPILWRIVRINEDGSIKLISEYNVGLFSIFNSTGSDYGISRYINDDGSNSEIKDELEKWYNTHITETNIDNIIQYGDYCNDISGIDFNDLSVYGNADNRMRNFTPIYTCPNTGLMINEKIGLITADEMMYGGAFNGDFETTQYTFFNNNTNFWTMTPDQGASMFVWEGGYFTGFMGSVADGSDEFAATRPVITIKADAIVSDGTGISTDPYIIKY